MASAPMFLFLAAGAVGLFTFLSIAAWSGTQAHERKARDRFALLKALAEQTGENARHVLEMLRDQEEKERLKKEQDERKGYLIGGLCAMAAGVGVGVMVGTLAGHGAWTVGLIPLLIGAVLTAVGVASRARR
jgi:hypothetical protein